MKFQWLATSAALALAVLPSAASPARRLPSVPNSDDNNPKLHKNNAGYGLRGQEKRDYRLSVPANTRTGAITEELTVTTTTTVTGVPSSSSAGSGSYTYSSSSGSLELSSSLSFSSSSSSTESAGAVSGTSSSCESLFPILCFFFCVLLPSGPPPS